MKYLLSLVLIICLLSCNTSNEDKTKALVKEYLSKNLNDPKSYEEVSWGKIDSSFITFEERYRIELHTLEKLSTDAISELRNGDISIGNENKKSYDSLNLVIENLKKQYKPTFNSLMIRHDYRAKNAFGAVVLQSKTFYISDDFSKIISMN